MDRAWVVAIAVCTLILPAGGLVVAVVAALTTYKSSAGRVRPLISVTELLTVALQVTPAIMIYHHLDGSVTEVKLP